MGIFDRFRDHAKSKGKNVSDAAEREVNKKTGGRHEDRVDQAQQELEDQLGMDRDRPRPDRP